MAVSCNIQTRRSNMRNSFLLALIIVSMMMFPINTYAIDADEDENLLYDQGVELYNSGNYIQAIQNFESVLRINPNHSDAKEYLEKVRREKSTPATSSFQDPRDNKTYKTVKIGKQTWMAENLNYEVKVKGFFGYSTSKGSKCYDNKPANCNKYGRLYDWSTAKTACPSGWHLPSNEEWVLLIGDGGTAGTMLKAKSGWDKNGNGTDEFGFSAMPGGSNNIEYDSDNVGKSGSWWSSTATKAGYPYSLSIEDDKTYVIMSNDEALVEYYPKSYTKEHFFLKSVRCVENSTHSSTTKGGTQ